MGIPNETVMENESTRRRGASAKKRRNALEKSLEEGLEDSFPAPTRSM